MPKSIDLEPDTRSVRVIEVECVPWTTLRREVAYSELAIGGRVERKEGRQRARQPFGAAQPRAGKLLHYGRFVHPEGFESVSFAS